MSTPYSETARAAGPTPTMIPPPVVNARSPTAQVVSPGDGCTSPLRLYTHMMRRRDGEREGLRALVEGAENVRFGH